MFPHERSLVERLKNEPFVLLGINTDDKGPDFYREEAKKNGISWRSAIDGSTSGPICSKWGVEGFPTLYLIDAKGIIRQAWNTNGSPGDEILDREIDKLVAEAKAK
jgi:peroxiredoxin